MFRFCFTLCLVLCLPSFFQAQANQEIKAMIDSGRVYYYTDGDKTLFFSRKAYNLAESADDYWGKLNALQLFGEAYYTLGKLDSADYYFDEAMVLAKAENDDTEIANNYISKASIASQSGEYKQALELYSKGTEIQGEIGDSAGLCDAYLRIGNVYNSIGEHEKAIEELLRSIRICDAIDNRRMVGYNYGSIGIIYDKQREFEKAEEYMQKALEVFKEVEDNYAVASALNNLGILYKNKGDYERSIQSYQESLSLFEKMDILAGKNACYTNLGILHQKIGNFEAALANAAKGLQTAKEVSDPESEQDNLNTIALAYLGLDDLDQAEAYAMGSLEIASELGSLEKLRDVHESLSKIHEAKGNYAESLAQFKKYESFKDSVLNIERSAKINELQTKYETEKKDHAIEVLAKNAELDRAKKTRLWIGLGLTLLLGTTLLYFQRQQRIRDRTIFEQEKEIEAAKLENANLEKEKLESDLKFKQRELTAKVLQLARKNEFLQKLNDEVTVLREDAEGGIKDTARKLGRMIDRDIESETDWDDFLSSFRSVHSHFLTSLVKLYPDLSKTDLKLACLMKMNLSSGEIANLLNITREGVKKARYRLRKKMDLSPGQNIQEFLLSYPSQQG